jgi:hypothetical protein
VDALGGTVGQAAGDGDAGAGRDPTAGLTVIDLNDVAQLQTRFNADQGVPRLVLALAPT